MMYAANYKKILIVFLLTLLSFNAAAEAPAMTETKSKLKELETKITHLQHLLSNAHDKNSVLNKELAMTEKKISEGIRQLKLTGQTIEDKQQKITFLEQQVHTLNEQLQTQQQLLAKHLRARYTMGEYQPLKWLLNQDTPYTTSRLLTFYQYIVQSRQRMIEQVQSTEKELAINQHKLQQELTEQRQLQQQLVKNQKKLEQNQLYNKEIILSLQHDIQNKQQILEDYQRNKNNLSNLLKSLAQQSMIQTARPFIYMRTKLPRPVDVKRIQNMNQGTVFFANEGTPVTAVSPGKVVFSDWLKGYGLLLIIDHGRGFMTLYAHNQSLFKQKGDIVDQGEQIATVGHSGGLKENGLYFEIRQRGKAVPPLRWLS